MSQTWIPFVILGLNLVLGIGIGIIAFFLRRLVGDVDTLKGSLLEHARQIADADSGAKAANERAGRALDDIRRLDERQEQCRERCDAALERVKTELPEKYVRRSDIEKRLDVHSNLLRTVQQDISGMLSALQSQKDSLREISAGQATINERLDDLGERVAALEAKAQ